MVASSSAATILGAEALASPKMTEIGFFHVKPSTCSGGGGGVSKLTMTNSTLHRQNTHHACIRNGIPSLWLMIFSVPKTGKSRMNDAAPTRKPKVRVAIDACFVPRRQNTPNKNTVVIGGARSAAITLIASKMLEYL